MFQFPGFPPARLYIHLAVLTHYCKWVPPFGNLRVDGCLLLTVAYRSLPRPSSAPGTKAFTLCPSLLDQLTCISVLQDFLFAKEFIFVKRLFLLSSVKTLPSHFEKTSSFSCLCVLHIFDIFRFHLFSDWLHIIQFSMYLTICPLL